MTHRFFAIFLSLTSLLQAGVDVDIDAFGESLGGWKKDQSTVDYTVSGSSYRSYKPEITPTPDGGIFVSLRIDHRRGWLASDDHAVLELSFGPDGSVVSAQSSLAIQGRTISSDLIRGTADAGSRFSGVQGAVRIGTNLVADLSSKLLREKIVEAGRVNYPAVLRHNYNLLVQAVRPPNSEPTPIGQKDGVAEAKPEEAEKAPAASPQTDPDAATDAPTKPAAKPLEIRPYGKGAKKL